MKRENEKERRRILPLSRRNSRCSRCLAAGRKSWISVRTGIADDTSERVKRRRSERDGKSRGSPPVTGEKRKVYRKDIREVADRQERATDARARETTAISRLSSASLPPPPSLLPLSNATSIVLVRGFCAVAIRVSSSSSPAGYDVVTLV